MARPSKFTQEIADQICDTISASNKGLASICKDLKIAPSSVFKWLTEHKAFTEQYARAREAQADYLADEMLEIADDSSQDTLMTDKGPIPNTEWINRSKLRVDARKWIASKLKPKKYGDKLDVTSGGEPMKKQVFKIGETIIEL